MYSYESRIQQAQYAITEAPYLLIGGGAGLSDAAGLKFSGPRFTENFAPFIAKYGFEDLYTSSFYPFATEEERWAYWAKHISINRFEQVPTQLYQDLLRLVEGKEYFVVTTNVEAQFVNAGFPPEKVFAVQGDYAYLSCAKACHDRLYYNEELVAEMIAQTENCRIPSALVPKCPVCGGPLAVHVRSDDYFVQDQAWYEAQQRYQDFVQQCHGKRVVYLELGVGFNTPVIIRQPFERLTYANPQATLIRANRDYSQGVQENRQRTVSFAEDMGQLVKDLLAPIRQHVRQQAASS